MAEVGQLSSDMGALHVVYQVGAQAKTFVADPETFHEIFPNGKLSTCRRASKKTSGAEPPSALEPLPRCRSLCSTRHC